VSGSRSKTTRGGSSGRGSRKPVVPVKSSTPWGLIGGVVAILVIAALVFGGVFLSTAEQRALQAFAPTAENRDPSTAIEGVQVVEFAGGQHIQQPTQVAYTHSPPMGGAHDFAWAACNGVVYDAPVRSENLVHSLEHGAVWIAYDPARVSGPALDALRARVDGEQYMVLSPYPDLDQPISLQSWGHQLFVDAADDPRIGQFVDLVVFHPDLTPEPGAPCDSPSFLAAPRTAG